MANENPILTLNDKYIAIINGSIIKYSYMAEKEETLSMRKYVDAYLDAYYKRDTFDLYTYTQDEYVDAGVTDTNSIINYLTNQDLVPKPLREKLLENRRNTIIANYVEKNSYYRMLNGYPTEDEVEHVYIDYDTALLYGVDPTIPVNEIEDRQGSYYINRLEAAGVVKKLIEENPDKEYLKYIGTRRIDILDARRAKNFELLYLDSSLPDSIYDNFTQIYESCREYFMSTIYIAEYRNVIDYYDRFIGMCIMLMALQQLTCRSLASSIDRNYFDTKAVQALYEAYDIPYFSNLDETTQKTICQNINLLIQNKGTNKVIYDIASLLGYGKIDVYKYYIMKEHLMDKDGNPMFVTKEQFDENTGTYKTVYDYEKMYDVYFQKVLLDDWDYYEALENKRNRVGYESVTSGDPLWIEDDDLYKEIWESEYNYKESKYLGITISYKLSEMIYENILLLRMLMDQKTGIENLDLKLPMITGNLSVSLFDTVVLLCALTSKKYGLKGEIITTASKTLAVLDGLQELDDPYAIAVKTTAFNFDYFKDMTDLKDKTSEIYQYMSESEIKELEGYLTILTIDGSTKEEKIDAINDMYQNIRNLSKFLSSKMAYSETVEEYRAFMKFFDALYYSNETRRCFTVTDSVNGTRVADTFLNYLEMENPSLADFVKSLDRENCYTYIDHVISRLEDIVKNLQYMYVINNSTSSIQEVLIALIRFFKSYTTDLIGLNIVYIFDFKPDNIMKLFDKIWKIRKTLGLEDDLDISYSDSIRKLKETIRFPEDLKLNDMVRIHAELMIASKFSLIDRLKMIKLIQSGDYMKWLDDVRLHAKITLTEDSIHLVEKLHHIHSKEFINESLKLLDKILIEKKIMSKEELSLYDTISREHSEIRYDDYTGFRDSCYVIHNS